MFPDYQLKLIVFSACVAFLYIVPGPADEFVLLKLKCVGWKLLPLAVIFSALMRDMRSPPDGRLDEEEKVRAVN